MAGPIRRAVSVARVTTTALTHTLASRIQSALLAVRRAEVAGRSVRQHVGVHTLITRLQNTVSVRGTRRALGWACRTGAVIVVAVLDVAVSLEAVAGVTETRNGTPGAEVATCVALAVFEHVAVVALARFTGDSAADDLTLLAVVRASDASRGIIADGVSGLALTAHHAATAVGTRRAEVRALVADLVRAVVGVTIETSSRRAFSGHRARLAVRRTGFAGLGLGIVESSLAGALADALVRVAFSLHATSGAE